MTTPTTMSVRPMSIASIVPLARAAGAPCGVVLDSHGGDRATERWRHLQWRCSRLRSLRVLPQARGRSPRGRRAAEMGVRALRRDASPRRALEVPGAHEVRLVHLLDGLGV